MSFATIQDMIDAMGVRLQQILNVHSSAEINASTALAKALKDANGKATSYLIGNYTLPLVPPSDAVNEATRSIAKYYLIRDTRRELMTEDDRTDFEDAIRWFEKVSEGKIKLTPPGTEPLQVSGESIAVPLGADVECSTKSSDQCWFKYL